MKVQVHEDFTASPLEDLSAYDTRRWGVLDAYHCTGVIVEAVRSCRPRSGHHMSAQPTGLYIAEAGSMTFQRGLFAPLGRRVMRASVSVAEVSLLDIPLGDLHVGDRVEYYEERLDSGASRVSSRPKVPSAGAYEEGQPEKDLERLERGIVTAIGARFISLTGDLEMQGEKFAIPQMVPRFEPLSAELMEV